MVALVSMNSEKNSTKNTRGRGWVGGGREGVPEPGSPKIFSRELGALCFIFHFYSKKTVISFDTCIV